MEERDCGCEYFLYEDFSFNTLARKMLRIEENHRCVRKLDWDGVRTGHLFQNMTDEDWEWRSGGSLQTTPTWKQCVFPTAPSCEKDVAEASE